MNSAFSFPGGLFVNFAIAAVLDFPAKLLALLSLVWLGRRLPYISLTLLAAACFCICLFIPRDQKYVCNAFTRAKLVLS